MGFVGVWLKRYDIRHSLVVKPLTLYSSSLYSPSFSSLTPSFPFDNGKSTQLPALLEIKTSPRFKRILSVGNTVLTFTKSDK
ncbi:hypothetical protein [Photorhabdus luminescens]|uniref:hypothetical protein n=1 Tax=Photorhabdus luminescens TaxID=29488 RepID=UPI001131D974|nr:hypothetical protein [Photorhabdus luminescens]